MGRLTHVVEYLTQEMNEKEVEIEALIEENSKYLDLIIKHSLGGVSNKSIR